MPPLDTTRPGTLPRTAGPAAYGLGRDRPLPMRTRRTLSRATARIHLGRGTAPVALGVGTGVRRPPG